MKKQRSSLILLCISAMCTAFLVVCSFVTVPVGHLRITLQLLAVLLTSALLPPLWACGAVLSYILLGIAGVPVFSGFTGGIGAIAGPTGGFILGFLPAVLVSSIWLHRLKKRDFFRTSGVFAVATLICYIVGTVGFCIYMPDKGLKFALTAAVLPYIPFDLLKIAAAAFLSRRLCPYAEKFTKRAD